MRMVPARGFQLVSITCAVALSLAPRHLFLFLTAGHIEVQTPEVQPRDCDAFPIHHREYVIHSYHEAPTITRRTDSGGVEQLRGEGYNPIERGAARIRGDKGNKFLVMDADLQHPPESVPLFFTALSECTPFAMGTRYGEGGAVDKDWPMYHPIFGLFGLIREPANKIIFRYLLHLAALYRWRLGFVGVFAMEVALVGACWVAL
ncbi:hypothetical protein K438DRAFT_1982181 [Mycena galopus ATCC 62051]|nr:hypothetical protein K438DRAFT_1982181 [Mycena galopus ATCC 62051]